MNFILQLSKTEGSRDLETCSILYNKVVKPRLRGGKSDNKTFVQTLHCLVSNGLITSNLEIS